MLFFCLFCLLALRNKLILERDCVMGESCKLSRVSAAPPGISSCSHQSPGPRSQTEIDQLAGYCLSAFPHIIILPESHIASKAGHKSPL